MTIGIIPECIDVTQKTMIERGSNMSVKAIEYIAERDQQTEADRNEIQLKIIRNVDSFKAISDEWNALAEVSDTHIYQTFEWQRTWWKYFCEGRESHELYIILFYSENQLVGIAPFFIDHFKFNHKTIYRCLRLIGSKVMQDNEEYSVGQMAYTDSLDLIIRPGYDESVFLALWHHLERADWINDIIMDEIPEYSSLFKFFVPLIKNQKQEWDVSVSDSSIYQIINLPETWEKFLKTLSHNARKKIRKCLKMADDSYGGKLFVSKKVEDTDGVEKAFKWLVGTHQHRWNRRGRPGVFADNRLHGFYESLTMMLNKQGMAEFQVVTVPDEGNSPIAMDLIYKYKKIVYTINTGFDNSSIYARYSPGHISLFSIIKEAIAEGEECVTFARGDEDYKFRASNQIVKNKNIEIHKVSASGTHLFLLYRMLDRIIFINRRMRFEKMIIQTYLKEYKIITAVHYYLLDLYYRISLKFRKIDEHRVS